MTDIAEQLRRVVLRDPARVSLGAKIAEAMAAMSGASAGRTAATDVAPEHGMAAASCLVVVDNEKVVGLLTAQDFVRFAVEQLPLGHLTLREVLGELPVTVKESSLTDLAGVLQLFEQHQLSYLPILDEQDCLAGLISCESLLRGGSAISRPPEISQDSLQAAARQPAEAQQRSREQRYASLIATTPVGIAHTDINGIFTYANERYCEIVGFELADVIGQHWSLGKSPEVQEQFRQEFEQSQRENRPMGIEYSIHRPDGLEVWAYGEMAMEYDAEGNVTGYLATITDISDRKRAELLLAGQQKVLERIARAEPLTEILEALLQVTEFHLPGTQCSIFLCVNDRLQFAAAPTLSRAYCDASNGAPIGEGIGSCGTAAFRKEVVVTSDIATDPLWQNYRDLALAYGLRACWSAPILGSDQTTVSGVFGIYYRDQRVPKAQDLELLRQSANIAGIAIEQSASMQALKQLNQELEQRVAERTIALQASEERWQLALKGANDGIWDWDLKQNLKFFSSRWKAMRGFRDEEIGTSPEECLSRIHPEDYERAMAEVSAHIAGETEFFECEYRARCKDGSYIWVLDRGQARRDEAGQAIRLIGSDTDITARKQAEMARCESERRYASLASAAPVAIFRFDTPLHCVYVNDRWSEMTGRPVESAMGYGWIEAVHPDDRVLNIDQWIQDYAEARPDTHIIKGTEARHVRPDGTITWFHMNISQELDDDGNVLGYVGTLTDITARKAAELALQEKQAQFQRMTENVPGMIFRYVLHPDKTDELTYVSSQIREVFELEPEAALQSANLLWERVHPDDVPWIVEARQVSADTLQPMTKAYRLCLPKKGLRWMRHVSHVERLANGDVVWDGIAIDITDRKQQEQERERLLKIVESTSDYIGVASAEGYILWHNQAFKNFRPDLGHSADRIHLSVANPAWAYETMQKEAFPTAIEQGTWSGESVILDADGNEVPISQVLIAHKSDVGEVEYFSTIIRDISDRKAIERQLEFTQYGLDHAADCFYCLDEEAHIKQVNQATCQRTGYTQEELLSMTLHELTPTCTKEKTWKPHWEKLKRLKSYSFESVQRTKTGEIFPVEVVCNYLEFDGKAYDFELIRDITARKAAEAQKNQHLAAIEAAADGIAILQANRYVYLNNSHLAILGYTSEELLGKSWHCLYSAEVFERFEQEIWPLLERDRAWQGEVIAIRKDGSCFDQCLSLTLLDEDLLICVFSDISDRKTAEQELILKQNHLEALLNNIPHMAWIKDEKSRFIAVNQPFAEAAGEPAEALVGKSDYEYWPFELAQAYRDDDLQVLQSGQRKVVEEELSRSDGTVRWLETTKTPFRDAQGELAGTVGIAADITDRKIAELALKDSQAQFQSMTENIPGMVYRYILHTDGSDELTYVSSQVREIFEVDPEAALQDTAQIWNRIHPDDVPWLGEAIQVSAKTLQPFTSAYRLILPNKGLRWVQNMSHVEQRNNGDVVWDGVVGDISDRIQAEAEQQRQLAILASTSDFIGTFAPDGNILYLNKAWKHLLQVDRDTPANRTNISEKHPAWALERLLNDALPEAASQGMWCGETALLDGIGQEIPVSQVIIAHKSSHGDEVEYFSTIIRDISERKQAEQKLQALSERLELALEGAKIGVWQWDYQNERLSWDERMFAIYGAQPESFGGTYQDWLQYVHPDDLADTQEEIIHGDGRSSKEFRIVRSDGTIRYLFSTVFIQKNQKGECERAVGINLDITDRKQAEIALEEEVSRRSAVFNTSYDGIHILDRVGNLMEANTGFAQMLGYSLEELSHLNIADWNAQFSHTEIQARFQNYPADMHSTLETLHRRKDGIVFPVEITVCSMEWNGELAFVCIARDISERKKYEIKLQQTNDELARATRLKDEFLANMSHELRTPLNSILGFSEALKEQILGPLEDKQIKALETIERSGNHLLKLINDILDVAKIEAGKISLNKQWTDVSYVCNSSISFIKQQALKKNIQLTINIPPNLPKVLIDERRILQVLINLLDNAVKFTPEGGEIVLEACYQEQANELGKTDLNIPSEEQDVLAQENTTIPLEKSIKITVSDTGIGISPKEKIRLFEPFVQVDSALNRKYEGTGLGLALVKRIVELHGGIVALTSEVDVGSCFSLNLPMEPNTPLVEAGLSPIEPQPPQPLIPSQSRQHPLILLAEDNESNVNVTVSYLEFHGYNLIVAKNGVEAIELAKSHEPSLILMDIQMPQMNGIEAMKRIRQDEQIKDTPILALTALAMKGDEERCLLAGANAYLSKPVKLKQLQQLVSQLIGSMP